MAFAIIDWMFDTLVNHQKNKNKASKEIPCDNVIWHIPFVNDLNIQSIFHWYHIYMCVCVEYILAPVTWHKSNEIEFSFAFFFVQTQIFIMRNMEQILYDKFLCHFKFFCFFWYLNKIVYPLMIDQSFTWEKSNL